jgi:DNA-binding NarL/FixJ family response regulator
MLSPRPASDRPLCTRTESPRLRTILVVDDQPIAALGLADLIERESNRTTLTKNDSSEGRWMSIDIPCRCVTARCEQALKFIEEVRPALVILDIACRRGRGLKLLREVCEAHPSIKTLVYTAQDEKIFARRILLAGSVGFVSKRAEPPTVIAAIRQVLAGQLHFSSNVVQRLSHSSSDETASFEPAECLSERELEVFTRIGHGETNRVMARELGVKPKTIDSYREKIKVKLSLEDSVQLVHCAVRWVVVQGE